jgi:hypothetical protein
MKQGWYLIRRQSIQHQRNNIYIGGYVKNDWKYDRGIKNEFEMCNLQHKQSSMDMLSELLNMGRKEL